MDEYDAVEPLHQFVLLAVIELRHRENVPVHSFDVTSVCEEQLAAHAELADLFPGGVTRQRVINALSALEEADLLDKETKRSSTGKGRPAYSLAIDETDVLAGLEDDDRFAGVVDRVREKRDAD